MSNHPVLAPRVRLLSTPPSYSVAEEIAHCITHGVGALLAVVGLCVLVVRASLYGKALDIVSASVFGAALVLLYTSSTLYHGIPLPGAKSVLRKLDQSMVYLLIAGTYTPFNLITLQGSLGWWLFALTWGIALFGVVFCVVDHEHHERFALSFYLGLGWCVVFAAGPLLERMAFNGLLLIVGGGLCYTVGVAFYLRQKSRFFHAIWHLFVLAGSAMHFFAVLLYVLPADRLS